MQIASGDYITPILLAFAAGYAPNHTKLNIITNKL